MVNGAAGGLGSAVAVRLAQAGMHVVVTDLSVDTAQTIVADVTAVPARIQIILNKSKS
ncbi:MAG: SDR family NAD(P)-dependent oxidoreductase [Bordetella sp.]|uniref:SDR family NAD(P)-dependent oxidoreductase n=1 Tax=Bordetella sp. TaxID=28081 RepID=UPI003F7BEA29